MFVPVLAICVNLNTMQIQTATAFKLWQIYE